MKGCNGDLNFIPTYTKTKNMHTMHNMIFGLCQNGELALTIMKNLLHAIAAIYCKKRMMTVISLLDLGYSWSFFKRIQWFSSRRSMRKARRLAAPSSGIIRQSNPINNLSGKKNNNIYYPGVNSYWCQLLSTNRFLRRRNNTVADVHSLFMSFPHLCHM